MDSYCLYLYISHLDQIVTYHVRPCEPVVGFQTNDFSNMKAAADHLENRLYYDLLSHTSLFKPGTSRVLRLNDYTHIANIWTVSLSWIPKMISSEQHGECSEKHIPVRECLSLRITLSYYYYYYMIDNPMIQKKLQCPHMLEVK